MKKHLLVLSLTFFGAISVFAQRTISGKVTDAGGEPLIGASVVVKGTSSGTVTDIDGSYSYLYLLIQKFWRILTLAMNQKMSNWVLQTPLM